MRPGIPPQDVFPGRGRLAPALFYGGGGGLCVAMLVAFLTLPGLRAGASAVPAALLDVPFHAQTAYQCGPAAVASVMNYWGEAITPETVAASVFSSQARGTLTLDLLLFVRKAGYEVRQGTLDLESVRREISERRPVLLLVDEGFWIVRRGHFLVVTGFDDTGLFIHDGREKNRHIEYTRLTRKWGRTQRWGMFMKPGGRP